ASGYDEKQNDNDLNDDPFLKSLTDIDPNFKNALNENKKYESLINSDKKESVINNPLIIEIENFLDTNSTNTKASEFKNRGGDKIYTRLKSEIKSLKSKYRENNRAYLLGDMSPEFNIKVLGVNSKFKTEYNNLIDLKEKLRSQVNPEDDGYDSPIEALYSREELEGDLENASILLEGADIVVGTIPIIKNYAKGVVKGTKYGVKKLRNSSYIKNRRISIKKMVKSKGLPTKGKIRFVPREADKKMGRILEKKGGYLDKFGNVWKKDMKHKDHWDIIDPRTNKKIKAKITYKKDSFKVTKNVDLKGKLKKGKGKVIAAEENLVVGSDV
ncbi:MAG: hypothetical protein GY830_06825, partial [Bacteroidetes bacterium]|nr:hypothetical protein [Bacteroidota bacterium]